MATSHSPHSLNSPSDSRACSHFLRNGGGLRCEGWERPRSRFLASCLALGAALGATACEGSAGGFATPAPLFYQNTLLPEKWLHVDMELHMKLHEDVHSAYGSAYLEIRCDS